MTLPALDKVISKSYDKIPTWMVVWGYDEEKKQWTRIVTKVTEDGWTEVISGNEEIPKTDQKPRFTQIHEDYDCMPPSDETEMYYDWESKEWIRNKYPKRPLDQG